MQVGSSIFQLYLDKCRFGFFVRRDTWEVGRHAKVIRIEFVKEGDMIDSTRHYYVRSINPSAERMWPPLVTLEADWFVGGIVEIDSGGNLCWEQVSPKSVM